MNDRVDEMLEMAAGRLAIDVDAGYTEGYERTLAREVYDCIPEGKRTDVLRWLIDGLVAGINYRCGEPA